jgi:hypothetical protein
VSADARLREMAGGYRQSQLVFLAARLRLGDLLEDGPHTAAELAESTATHAAPLRRVLRGMAVVGLVEELADGRFGPTELSAALRTSVRDNVLFTASEENTLAWAGLEHTLRTGVSGFQRAFGVPRFQYLQAHPEWADVFQSQMSLTMQHVARAVVEAYDFSGVDTVVDVGGGRGTLLSAVLRTNVAAKGVLFDLPEVAREGDAALRADGLSGRYAVQGGSFFDRVPSGGDLYMLSWILHDWPDADAARILATCATAIAPGVRVLFVERVLPDHADATPATREALMGDVHMLAVLTGRERTRAEFEALLDAAGFGLQRIVETHSPRSILEAVRLRG